MSLADEMRCLSEQGRKDLVFNQIEQMLKEIESAALRGENSIARYYPVFPEAETLQGLQDKGFTVTFIPAGMYTTSFFKISW